MNAPYIDRIARELSLRPPQVASTAALLAGGGTVPFIARYRKEATGSLDEVAITSIRDRLQQLEELDKRRAAILASLEERGLLTDALRAKCEAADTLAELEDLYLPFRPKRRTRATIAREKGLEPLAVLLFDRQRDPHLDPWAEAAPFIDPEKGVATAEEALAGARDILAERFSEDAEARARVRALYTRLGRIYSKVARGKEIEGAKYRDYFEASEPVSSVPSHRMLAMRRGETEGILLLRIHPPEENALAILRTVFVHGNGPAADQVVQALEDGYKRLLSLSLETEIRLECKRRADEEAIRVFAANLRELLLAPPLGEKRVLAIDPGFRTGCKIVCLDRQGAVLAHETIYPHTGGDRAEEAGRILRALIARHEGQAIAIGNGTAGRETEAFVRGLDLSGSIPIVMVDESGASIYSASEVAREEFPDLDLTVRGAISIGRRLMDPLAELVKCDPKSIGVGQYQHDVDQGALRSRLDDEVLIAVNRVGVEVNTASRQLLSYVSGLGPALAGNIVAYRDEHGAFGSRGDLKQVPRLGPKAFEQAAGFLRIRGGGHPLDASAVHPESYSVVEAMAHDLGCSVAALMLDEAVRSKIVLERYRSETVGMPTLRDILGELARPGRDPRDQFEAFAFAAGVSTLEDLKVGMKLPGVVTNLTAFGAFVDVGVHQDGLVHVSQLADRFVRDPSTVVKVHQRVLVTVLEVDVERRRIGLSMRTNPGPRRTEKAEGSMS
jgi:protein Tex